MSPQTFSLASKLRLANGHLIPQIQFGLHGLSGPQVAEAVPWALTAGYRGFDSAKVYNTEKKTGAAIREYLSSYENDGVQREDVFYTSKLALSGTHYGGVRRSITMCVRESRMDYIDLFLIDSRDSSSKAMRTSWAAMQSAISEGEVRSGGLCNFEVRHIVDLLAWRPRILPVVNLIEVHPFNTNEGIRAMCAKHGIVVEAYVPTAVEEKLMVNPTILEVARRCRCTPFQLIVRWSLQHGLVTLPCIPQSQYDKERLLANADVGGFEISNEDMATLDALDRGRAFRYGYSITEELASKVDTKRRQDFTKWKSFMDEGIR